MRSKIVLNFLYCIFSFMLLNLTVYANSFSSLEEKQVIETLNNFYRNYISEISKDRTNSQAINSLKNKYLTSALQDKITSLELHYDPIINAQDCSLELLDTHQIQKSKLNNDVYLVSYMDMYSKETIMITLSIVEENKSYKINNFLDMDRGTVNFIDIIDNQNEWNEFWNGNYKITTTFKDTGDIGISSIDYNISISENSCIFSGYGYRTSFEYECEVIKNNDNYISLRYVKTIDKDSLDQLNLDPTIPLLTISFDNDQYYIKSTLIYDNDFNIDVKVKVDKDLLGRK